MLIKTESLPLLDSQIERFSGLRFRWPSFPKSLEDRFEQDTAKRRCERLWLEGLLVICLYDLFLAADHLRSPSHFWHAMLIRLGLVTPLALAVNISMLRTPLRRHRETSIAIVSCVAGLSHLYLETGGTQLTSAFAQSGLIAAIVFVNTVMRLRFPYALAASGTMVLGDLVFLWFHTGLNYNHKVLGLCLMLGVVAATVIANYSSDREERLNYLLNLRGDFLAADLTNSNIKLSQLAARDALTDLANRFSFDQMYEQLWNAAAAQRTGLSVIMVDVDNFKQINDTYGHLHGDEVLRQIAHFLRESLREQADFAARIGGDEFVIVLPRTDESAALHVADRLRHIVKSANLLPLKVLRTPVQEVVATVSCGVATSYPTAAADQSELLAEADAALYQAKARGRNDIWSASFTRQQADR